MKKTTTLTLLTILFMPLSAQAAGGGATPAPATVSSAEHFHPKGKMPSEYTLKVLESARKELPFSDTRDFDNELVN